MYEKFTDRARQILKKANEEAALRKHISVGTEHVLLAMLRDPASVAGFVLKTLKVDTKKLTKDVENLLVNGEATTQLPDKPFTESAKQVLEASIRFARKDIAGTVGTEHLLLGLTTLPNSLAGHVLVEAGLTQEVVWETVKNMRISPESILDLTSDPAKKVLSEVTHVLADYMEGKYKSDEAVEIIREHIS